MKLFKIVIASSLLVLSSSLSADWRDALAEKAAAAKAAASEKANSALERAQEIKEDRMDNNPDYQARMASVSDSVNNMKNKSKDAAIKQSESLLENTHDALIELNKAGFRADEVWIESGLKPTLVVLFKDTGETGSENQILEQNKGRKIFIPVLKSLLATRKFHVAHYRLEKVRVHFSFPPKVILMTTVDGI